eukprot:scaffold2860_cov106-Isochrysis_galbana.AAC.9
MTRYCRVPSAFAPRAASRSMAPPRTAHVGGRSSLRTCLRARAAARLAAACVRHLRLPMACCAGSWRWSCAGEWVGVARHGCQCVRACVHGPAIQCRGRGCGRGRSCACVRVRPGRRGPWRRGRGGRARGRRALERERAERGLGLRPERFSLREREQERRLRSEKRKPSSQGPPRAKRTRKRENI